jgi:repressor LexA
MLRIEAGFKRQQDLADKIDVDRSLVSRWERDEGGLDHKMLQRLADVFSEILGHMVTTDYLIGREASKGPPENPTSRDLSLPNNALSLGLTTKIKILGRVVAGEPSEAEQIVLGEEEIPMTEVTGECFLLRVSGDSMAPTIQDGGLVFVVKQATVEDGEVAVVMVGDDNEGTLKRIRRMNGKILLQPDNPNYAPISVDPAQIRVVGRAMWVKYDIGKKRTV